MKNYQNIPTGDWVKYPETTPNQPGYYLTTYFEGIHGSNHSFGNLSYACLYWDNQNQNWICPKIFEIGCFVESTRSENYTEFLDKLKELYYITTC